MVAPSSLFTDSILYVEYREGTIIGNNRRENQAESINEKIVIPSTLRKGNNDDLFTRKIVSL